MRPHERHRQAAHEKVGFLVVTVSSSRYESDRQATSGRRRKEKVSDESGDVAERIITEHGHMVKGRRLISDDPVQIETALRDGLLTGGIDAVLFTGGTGLSPTDVTIEAVRPHLQKEIEGFGELFRAISFKEIGFAAALSRATAGIAKGKLVLCLPGSPDGVKSALDLCMEDLPHIIHIAAGRH